MLIFSSDFTEKEISFVFVFRLFFFFLEFSFSKHPQNGEAPFKVDNLIVLLKTESDCLNVDRFIVSKLSKW